MFLVTWHICISYQLSLPKSWKNCKKTWIPGNNNYNTKFVTTLQRQKVLWTGIMYRAVPTAELTVGEMLGKAAECLLLPLSWTACLPPQKQKSSDTKQKQKQSKKAKKTVKTTRQGLIPISSARESCHYPWGKYEVKGQNKETPKKSNYLLPHPLEKVTTWIKHVFLSKCIREDRSKI